MLNDKKIKELAEHFRVLGASQPEQWARSQVEEGIPQYARFVFLREAWRSVISEGDVSWIEVRVHEAEKDPRGPGSGCGPALKRMLDAGISRDDIAEVVRVMQWTTLFQIMYQLSDPGCVNYPNNKMPRVNWELFETDNNYNPIHPIDGLHESVLDTEPSGREMRPKGVTRDG